MAGPVGQHHLVFPLPGGPAEVLIPSRGPRTRHRSRFACVDVTVTSTRKSVTEIDFEGLSLAETLSAVGPQEEAQAADGLLGKPAEEVSDLLRELLARLFETDAN